MAAACLDKAGAKGRGIVLDDLLDLRPVHLPAGRAGISLGEGCVAGVKIHREGEGGAPLAGEGQRGTAERRRQAGSDGGVLQRGLVLALIRDALSPLGGGAGHHAPGVLREPEHDAPAQLRVLAELRVVAAPGGPVVLGAQVAQQLAGVALALGEHRGLDDDARHRMPGGPFPEAPLVPALQLPQVLLAIGAMRRRWRRCRRMDRLDLEPRRHGRGRGWHGGRGDRRGRRGRSGGGRGGRRGVLRGRRRQGRGGAGGEEQRGAGEAGRYLHSGQAMFSGFLSWSISPSQAARVLSPAAAL